MQSSSPLFQFFAGQYARKLFNIDRAVRHLTRAVEACKKAEIQPSNYYAELGTMYLIEMDFTLAAEAFDASFNTENKGEENDTEMMKALRRRLNKAKAPVNMLEMRPYAGIGLAACLISLGEPESNEKAMNVMRSVKDMLLQVAPALVGAKPTKANIKVRQ